MGFMVLALGLAVLFNFIIIRVKWSKGNYLDVGVDIAMLLILNTVFGGTILGVVSATAGSTLISLYLIWRPIKLLTKGQTIGEFIDSKVNSSQNTTNKNNKSFADILDDLIA